MSLSRRDFVAAALAGVGDLAFLHGLPTLTAADVKDVSGKVRLEADIEPLVRLIEETPREQIIEAVAGRVRKGTSYGELLAAVLLAGARSIRPRPVGFEFHCVLAVHSAHLAALAADDKDRWLPMFWAVDNFKSSQNTKVGKKDNWAMPQLYDDKLPAAPLAKQRFVEAMEAWDEEAADRAAAALARAAGAAEAIEPLWRLGCRDFRDIGHKAIYVANGYRTLETIGWRHAEPVLRSLAFALLEHEGDNPAKRDGDPDRPGRENLKRIEEIGPGWLTGKLSPEAGAEVLRALRTATPAEASALAVDLIKKGVHPSSIWDGLFLTAGELLLRQPGIVGVHCVTATNALHHAYESAAEPRTRQLTLLQAAAFLPMFRKAMEGRGKLAEVHLDTLAPIEVAKDPAAALTEVFAETSKDRLSAAGKALALLNRDGDMGTALSAAARRLVFLKGRDSHDYKFSSALLEDFRSVSPAWRARVLASGMAYFRGSGEKDNDLVKRTREALG
jgi:hypothetical protein